jgi:hypothetical protein
VIPPILFANALLLWIAIEALRARSDLAIRRLATTPSTGTR